MTLNDSIDDCRDRIRGKSMLVAHSLIMEMVSKDVSVDIAEDVASDVVEELLTEGAIQPISHILKRHLDKNIHLFVKRKDDIELTRITRGIENQISTEQSLGNVLNIYEVEVD